MPISVTKIFSRRQWKQNMFGILTLLALALFFQNCADINLLPVDGGKIGEGVDLPLPEENSGKVAQLSNSAGQQTCVLLENKTVKCWGVNKEGQLGNSTAGEYSSVPVPVEGLERVKALSSGGSHTCALLEDETVKCWGSNFAGQLGNGNFADSVFTPVQVVGLTGVKKIFAGYNRTCALLSGGRARCWGYNMYDVVGTGEPWVYGEHKPNPVIVKVGGVEVSGLREIDAGGLHHTCGIKEDNTLTCWGSLTFMPAIAEFQNVKEISSAVGHACILFFDQKVKCWGLNSKGDLGRGTVSAERSTEALPVKGIGGAGELSGVVAIRTSTLATGFSCALLSEGQVACWGSNFAGMLGNGSTVDYSSTPVLVKDTEGSEITNIDIIAVGLANTCALSSLDNKVKCWGYNNRGQLGNGTLDSSSVATGVMGLED